MMRGQVLSVVAAFITLAALYLAGVLLLLDPVAAREVASVHLLPLPLAFLIAMALVNVDFVLSGKRDIATAAASTVILCISWSAVAWVYGRLKPKRDLSQSASGRVWH